MAIRPKYANVSTNAPRRTERDAHESDQAEVGYFVVPDKDVPGKMDLVRREQTPIDFEPLKGGIVNVVAEDIEQFELRYLTRLRGSGCGRGIDPPPPPRAAESPSIGGGHRAGTQGCRGRPAVCLPHQGVSPDSATSVVRDPATMKGSALLRARRRKRERGVALIMVLGAIAVMIVMLAEFQDEAGAEFAAATAARDSVQAEYFARSAISLSRLLIAAEPTMRQGIAPLFMLMKRSPPQLPVWEYLIGFSGPSTTRKPPQDFLGPSGLDPSQGKNLGLKGGHFEIQIVDEDAKINVNMGAANEIAHIRLAKQLMSQMMPIQYNPLFEQRDATGNYNDRLTICSAIIDWADADEQLYSCDLTNAPSSNAVEDASYQLLTKPYRRKNAPYDSLEELHMVRGVTDDYWSTFIDPDPVNPKKRQMTVWGQGTVNVNSANPLTLYAQHRSAPGLRLLELCTDLVQMQTFVMGLTMGQAITMGAPLFGSANDFISTMKGQGTIGPLSHDVRDEAREVPIRERRFRRASRPKARSFSDLRGRRRKSVQAGKRE